MRSGIPDHRDQGIAPGRADFEKHDPRNRVLQPHAIDQLGRLVGVAIVTAEPEANFPTQGELRRTQNPGLLLAPHETRKNPQRLPIGTTAFLIIPRALRRRIQRRLNPVRVGSGAQKAGGQFGPPRLQGWSERGAPLLEPLIHGPEEGELEIQLIVKAPPHESRQRRPLAFRSVSGRVAQSLRQRRNGLPIELIQPTDQVRSRLG